MKTKEQAERKQLLEKLRHDLCKASYEGDPQIKQQDKIEEMALKSILLTNRLINMADSEDQSAFCIGCMEIRPNIVSIISMFEADIDKLIFAEHLNSIERFIARS